MDIKNGGNTEKQQETRPAKQQKQEDLFFVRQYVTEDEYFYWAEHPLGKSAVSNRKWGIALRVTGVVLSVMMLLMGFLQGKGTILLCGAIFLALYLMRLFVLPKKMAQKQYGAIVANQKDDLWLREYHFGAEQLVVRDDRTETTYLYNEIQRFTEEDRHFVLWINANSVLRIPKVGFFIGEKKDFPMFVRAKLAVRETKPQEKQGGLRAHHKGIS